MYEPAEDSYLLLESINNFYVDKRIKNSFDMGSGSGILAKQLAEFSEHVIAVDIDDASVEHLKKELKNSKISVVKSDLFSNIKKEKFDLIVFNPPYLPKGEEDYDDAALYGGEKGIEITLRFLEQAKEFLAKTGIILFVASSLSKLSELEIEMKKMKYSFEKIKQEHYFFEELYVYKAKLKD